MSAKARRRGHRVSPIYLEEIAPRFTVSIIEDWNQGSMYGPVETQEPGRYVEFGKGAGHVTWQFDLKYLDDVLEGLIAVRQFATKRGVLRPIEGDEQWFGRILEGLQDGVNATVAQQRMQLATQPATATPTPAHASPRGSRRAKLSGDTLRNALRARDAGKSLQEIADDLGVDKSTVSRALSSIRREGSRPESEQVESPASDNVTVQKEAEGQP